MIHEQVITKVNMPVDRGVRPLVDALNEFSEVITVESCEGQEETDAYVSFHVGDDWHGVGDFAQQLSGDLGGNPALSDAYYSLSVEWYAGGNSPLGYLRVPRRHVSAVADAIRCAALAHHERP
jgi:hypothetical protein